MKEFFTRERANEGVKLPLYHPDGTPSEHWLRVRGIDSDNFRRAETKSKQSVMELIAIKDDKTKEEKIEEVEIDLIASLVVAWSFPQEFTREEVIKFLIEAPQIREQVNSFAARRSVFFSKKSKPSVTGSKKRSSSRKDQRAQKSPSETT